MDNILAREFPKDCFYLIQGDPGFGKTTLALQFLLEGIKHGENVLYVSLSESKHELLKVAASHSRSLKGIPLMELAAFESLLRPEAQTTVFRPSELGRCIGPWQITEEMYLSINAIEEYYSRERKGSG